MYYAPKSNRIPKSPADIRCLYYALRKLAFKSWLATHSRHPSVSRASQCQVPMNTPHVQIRMRTFKVKNGQVKVVKTKKLHAQATEAFCARPLVPN